MVKPQQKAGSKRKGAAPYLKPSKRSKPSAPQPAPGKKQASKANGKDEETLNGNGKQKPKRAPDQPKKIRQRDQKTIPVPESQFEFAKAKRVRVEDFDDDDDEEEDEDMDSDQDDLDDMGLGVEAGLNSSFLAGVDTNALSRSNKETERLHKLAKRQQPLPKPKKEKTRFPSPGSAGSLSDYDINSDDELSFGDEEFSDLDDEVLGTDDEDEGDDASLGPDDIASDSDSGAYSDSDSDSDADADADAPRKRKGKQKESEADYELTARSRWAANDGSDAEAESAEVGRLPIKLPSGQVQQVEGTTKIALPPTKQRKKPQPEPVQKEEIVESDNDSDDGRQAKIMATQKGKFGRVGVAEIVSQDGWRNAQKLEAAKEQIAQLGAEILAGGELIDIAPVLTRLSTFALPSVPSPESQKPIPVPNSIRGVAFLSQLAVFKDLAPGYRIRQLTEQEETEKVRDEVKRLREGEKMLVRSYKGYLKLMEAEVKKRTPLASISLKCMCDLLSGITHFNFSENIMGVLVGRIGRRSWDQDSEAILQSFITVFRSDTSGHHSQSLVRLMARMTKERKFQIHPNVLSCFLRLRLADELDHMRDSKKAAREQARRDAQKQMKRFKSDTRKKWATKNQKAKEKEMKEVEKDMKEAAAEVDKEERAQVQTETLKNLFVLYFSILKNQARTPLLPAALEGIVFFAHFINIEFFRDLLAVLRKIITDHDEPEDEDVNAHDHSSESNRIRVRLLAICTAFELLSGQGESINIDLSDFINTLFALLRPLSLDSGIEDPPPIPAAIALKVQPPRPLIPGRQPGKQSNLSACPTSYLLVRCLYTIFYSRHTASPQWRSAAFIKRLTESALHFPPRLAKDVLEFVRTIVGRDAALEGMLDSEERLGDGVYKPELDDPQLSHALATSLFEPFLLENRYFEKKVRMEGKKLGEGSKVNNIR